MSDKGEKSVNRLLVAVVVVLLAVVVGQSAIMMKTHAAAPMQQEPSAPADQARPAGAGDAYPGSTVVPVMPDGSIGSDMGPWDPFRELRSIRQQMDQMFNDSLNRFRMSPDFESLWGETPFSPNMDVEESDGKYVVRMDIPGADKSNISVNIAGRALTVSGSIDETVEEQGTSRLHRERRSGQFSRTVTLPGPVQADEMKAQYEDGVLVVTVPRSDQDEASLGVEVQ